MADALRDGDHSLSITSFAASGVGSRGKVHSMAVCRRLATIAVLCAAAALTTPAAAPAAPAPAAVASSVPTSAEWTDVAYIGPGESVEMASGLGTFQFQLGNGSKGDRRILQLTLRLGPDATYNATWGATVSGAVRINGKNTGWTYNKASRVAHYVFHSSLDKFQYEGDAPWTSHRLHPGDVVDVAYTALIPNVDRSTTQANYRTQLILR